MGISSGDVSSRCDELSFRGGELATREGETQSRAASLNFVEMR